MHGGIRHKGDCGFQIAEWKFSWEKFLFDKFQKPA